MTVSSHSSIGSAEYNEVTNTKFYYGCQSKRVTVESRSIVFEGDGENKR